MDSGGSYIALRNPKEQFAFNTIQCYIKNDYQRKQVREMSSDCKVTLRGKCISVGEILGYSMDIDSIDGYEPKEEAEVNGDEYITCTAKDLINDLEGNALKAADKYKGRNLIITGVLGTIDSGGDYISLESKDNLYSFTNIQCFIKDETTLNKVMDMKKGQKITVKGKCRSVGEILGYSIDIESIE